MAEADASRPPPTRRSNGASSVLRWATVIFTRVDVVANVAVIVSGAIVLATGFRFVDSGGRRGDRNLYGERSGGDPQQSASGAETTMMGAPHFSPTGGISTLMSAST